jgi:hypothetical protein
MKSGDRTPLGYLLLLLFHVSWFSETYALSSPQFLYRKSDLLPWNKNNGVVLGTCLEERDLERRLLTVTVQIGHQDHNGDGGDICCLNESLRLTFSEDGNIDSLASQLWPAALASTILLRSREFRSWVAGKNVVELGCGRGLAGLVAAENSASCLFTDNDEDAIEMLRSNTCPNNQDRLQATLLTQRLDWRENHKDQVPVVDLVLGSDIAYYFHLLRPIMDTARAFMGTTAVGEQSLSPSSSPKGKPLKPTLLVIGQANRESQWDLYKSIMNGCYNQYTDEHEPPWPGTTKMLLFKMKMSTFCEQVEACESDESSDGVIPISVIVHQDEENIDDKTLLCPFESFAHVATEEDDENIMKSF